ncbi:MAG: YdeI/OmpD-associated family protein [Flavobacteriaceae bacterium]|nr:YdeI/OmpD-associated family protein [Flavobacteriaceae bacterium]
MKRFSTVDAYFEQEHPFSKGINILREIAAKTEFVETLKWGGPVYTIDNKNVLMIGAFKNHFGLWFFNGSYLSDPKKVLESAQEKTKGMRHWKFPQNDAIDEVGVLAYMEEAIANQKKGKMITPAKKTDTMIPELLQDALNNDPGLMEKFNAFSPYKQQEYCEHIDSAKQEKTKLARLEKSLPMIAAGRGLNDKYRNY